MGCGASSGPAPVAPVAPAPPAEADLGISPARIEAASQGDEIAQDDFFRQLFRFSENGDEQKLCDLLNAWPASVKQRGAWETSVNAARFQQTRVLQNMLDLGVDPPIGEDDEEVNPLIKALQRGYWDVVGVLVPKALQHDFSTKLLEESMLDFVVAGDYNTLRRFMKSFQIPGSGKLLCAALLLSPDNLGPIADEMVSMIVEHMDDFNKPSSFTPDAKKVKVGWESFSPIHAACRAKKTFNRKLIQSLIDKEVVLSEWGTEMFAETNWGGKRHSKTFAKRLPLHYAAENHHSSFKIIELLAKAYPEAMFKHVDDKPGRKLPCQCIRPSDEAKQQLEELMYEYVCARFDSVNKSEKGECIQLIRMALVFEQARTLKEHKLSRGKLSFVVEELMPTVLEASQDVDFTAELQRFVEAHPRVDLGRTSAAKVAVESIHNISEVLKSDFWQLLTLAECGGIDVAQLKELVNHELEARLKWVVSRISREGEGEGEGETAGLGTEGTTDSPSRSDAVRYGIFILSGLIAQIIAAQPKKVPKKDDEEDYEGHDFEGFEEDEDAGAESAVAEVLCSVGATLQSSETLDVIVGAYCQELQLPKDWNLLGVLRQGLDGCAVNGIFFSGGDLVMKKYVPVRSATFEWIRGLFENTFLHRYTRDRRGGKVPDALTVEEVDQVFNCGSWLEYEIRRQKVYQELQEKGPAWTGEFRTDVCTKGERAEWFQSDQYPGGINEHWLYHGTSGAGESGITEGDFRLNLAGSNAGTLYGNGAYLAEAVSKSDEYTTPHGAKNLRTILLCLSCLGRVNYNDEKRPDGDELANSCKGGGFQSILGDREKIRGTYREIIVFDDNLIYPGYICRYKRVEKEKEES